MAVAAGNDIGSKNTLSKNTLSKNTLSNYTLSNYTIGEIWRTPSPTKPDAHRHCGQGWLVEDGKLRTDGNSRRYELCCRDDSTLRRGGHDRHAFCHPVQWEYLMMCDWRMKKNNGRGGSGKGVVRKGGHNIYLRWISKNSPWRCRHATSPPPNLAPVHRQHSRSFSI